MFIGYEATIGGVWSHNEALDKCAATPTVNGISNRAVGISAQDSWTWWLPGHSHVCVYEMPDGRTIVRPVPSVELTGIHSDVRQTRADLSRMAEELVL